MVGQDEIRRGLLKVRDTPGNASVDLIDTIVRHTVDRGFDAVVEGIFHAPTYAEMLLGLAADHRGTTTAWFYDLPWEETLRRHADKQVSSYGEGELARWWNGRQLIPGLAERLIPTEWSLDRTVAAVAAECGRGPLSEERGR